MDRFLENIFSSKELYLKVLTPVCEMYNLSHTEMIILLCLSNHPQLDTATDIVNLHKLTKSAVSMSVGSLQEKGLITGEHLNGNRRSIHLKICEAAAPMIEEGQKAQRAFLDIVLAGFTDEDKDRFKRYFERIATNIDFYTKSK